MSIRSYFSARLSRSCVRPWGRDHVILLCLSALLAACAAPPAPAPQRPLAPTAAVAFDAAIDFAVDDLLTQAQRLPEFAPPAKTVVETMLQQDKTAPRSKIVVDNALDSRTGQQTLATRFLDARLLMRAKVRFPQFDVLAIPISGQADKGLSDERFLLAATLSPLAQESTDTQARFRINLSITDLRSGYVLAQAGVNTTAVGVDATPTSFYQDSPSLVRDRIVEGQARTAQAKTGTEADPIYVANLTVSSLITEGVRLYDASQFEDALRIYEVAAARPDGKQLRVFNGLYLSNMQLGRTELAEQAFGRIVALGLSTNSLSFKFLFKPGSVDFLQNPKVSGPYAMWLRVLAREMASSQQCVGILGHSSRTGAESTNERLSLSRAVTIQRKLEGLAHGLTGRLQSIGMGFRENLVGTGTDDVRDAIDRRVEFRVRSCS